MLTNPCDAFSGQSTVNVTKHCTIRYVRYGLLVQWYNGTTSLAQKAQDVNDLRRHHDIFSRDIRLQKCRNLENGVRGPSRSLEMSPFDRARITSY